jgi:hypothetical protein
MSSSCFYEDLNVSCEYDISCDCSSSECLTSHVSIKRCYEIVSKVWLALDFLRSIQYSVPSDDPIFLSIISDLVRAIYIFADNEITINNQHRNDINNILYVLEDHVLLHPVVEYNEILFKTVKLFIKSIKNK